MFLDLINEEDEGAGNRKEANRSMETIARHSHSTTTAIYAPSPVVFWKHGKETKESSSGSAGDSGVIFRVDYPPSSYIPHLYRSTR